MDTQKMETSCRPIVAIILNWNGESLLREFLPQVVATTDPAITRLVVADNGSDDGSLRYLRDNWEGKVDILSFSENLEIGRAHV